MLRWPLTTTGISWRVVWKYGKIDFSLKTTTAALVHWDICILCENIFFSCKLFTHAERFVLCVKEKSACTYLSSFYAALCFSSALWYFTCLKKNSQTLFQLNKYINHYGIDIAEPYFFPPCITICKIVWNSWVFYIYGSWHNKHELSIN